MKNPADLVRALCEEEDEDLMSMLPGLELSPSRECVAEWLAELGFYNPYGSELYLLVLPSDLSLRISAFFIDDDWLTVDLRSARLDRSGRSTFTNQYSVSCAIPAMHIRPFMQGLIMAITDIERSGDGIRRGVLMDEVDDAFTALRDRHEGVHQEKI